MEFHAWNNVSLPDHVVTTPPTEASLSLWGTGASGFGK